MAEYIKREAAIDLITRRYENPEICTQEINSIPVADVAPVRHGRWLSWSRLYYGAKRYECSLCYEDTFWDKHSITEKYPYCPNCGAKMDGKRKDKANES